MNTPPRKQESAWRPSPGRLAIVLLMAMAVAAGLWLLWAPSTPAPPTAAAPAPAPAVTAAAPAPAPAPRPIAAAPAADPERDNDPTRDLTSYVARGENPSVSDVIARLHERGIHSGLGAFSPPGTSPPLAGLAVPEDFVLPKGYVRHHQATDDGQRIETILMFAPDYQMMDANNHPVPMPADRVVPPELAPAGLPIRHIVVPKPNDPNNPSH